MARKLTQEGLAEMSGVQRTLILRLEQGIGDTSSLRVRGLAKALGVSTDYLLGLTHDQTPR